MKLNTIENNVESTFGKGRRLTILATSKAMEILAKSLYSNPIEAVIREVGTNAADAHVIVGCKEKPFEVWLPTYQNQNFIVRDYGPGIPEDKVIDIFATYFSSTKTEDDTVTGCLGLGSKSPLAVASQFIVEIWHGGFYYVWNIYKDEEGYPSIPDGKPSVVMPTTEPTGVKITVPVDNISSFKSTAEKVYKYFQPIPTVYIGNNKHEIKPPIIKQQFTHYYVEGSGNFGVYALMGNVLYPINTQIKGLEGYANLNSQRVIIPFAIGDLKFSASRESLEYDPMTIHTLAAKYNNIIEDIKKTVQEVIEKEKNAFCALMKFKDMDLTDSISKALSAIITYKGKLLTGYYPKGHYTNVLPDSPVVQGVPPAPGLAIYSIGRYGGKKYQATNKVHLEKSLRLYYNDEGKDKGIVSKLYNLNGLADYVFMNDIRLDEWLTLNHFTRADLIPTSSIPSIAAKKRSAEYRKRSGLFKVYGGDIQKYFWTEIGEKAIIPEVAYYLPKVGDKYYLGGQECFLMNWDKFERFGLLPSEVYGVTQQYVKHYPKWLKVEDYIRAELLKIKDDFTLAISNRDTKGLEVVKYFDDGELKKKINIINKYNYECWEYHKCFSSFGMTITADPALKLNVDDIYKKYPLLNYIVNNRNVPEQDIKNYIKLVDKGSK